MKGHPSFVLASATGEVIDRWVGFKDVPTFLSTLRAAQADPTTLEQKAARFAAAPTAKDASILARASAASGDRARSLELYRRALELDPAGPYAQSIFEQTVGLYLKGEGGVGLDQVTQAASAATASSHATAETKMNVASTMRRVAQKAGDMKLIAPYLEAALDATKDATSEEVVERRRSLMVDQALHVKGDAAAAVELKRQTLPDGWRDSADELNAFAWWCFENKVNLEEAEALARKGVALLGPGAERAQVLDTVAELCNLRGNCSEAITLIRQAMKEDPDEEHYSKQLARFEKILAGKS